MDGKYYRQERVNRFVGGAGAFMSFGRIIGLCMVV